MGTKTKPKKDAIAPTEKTSTDVELFEYDEEDIGGGFEDHTAEDYKIPFFTILQGISDEVVNKTIEGAEPGKIINMNSKELIDGDEGFPFIPVKTTHNFIEWVPRKKGGGFVKAWPIDAPEVLKAKELAEEFGKYTMGENDLMETFTVFGIHATELEPIIISFKSAFIKTYRQWMSNARQKQRRPDNSTILLPLYCHVFRMKTFMDKNKVGQNFYNWDIKFDANTPKEARLAPESEGFLAAKALRDMIKQGTATANYNQDKAPEEQTDF